MTLAQLDFIERRQAVHFLGPPGTGKSHLSIVLDVEAVRAGKSVYLGSLAEVVNSMAKAEREGIWRNACASSRATACILSTRLSIFPSAQTAATCSSN